MPTRNTPLPMAIACQGNVATRSRQPARPAPAAGAGTGAGRVLGEGRGVGDGVVEQHPERRERDRAAQVDSAAPARDTTTASAISARCGTRNRGCTAASHARQVAFAGHRQRRAPDARDQREQRPERGAARRPPARPAPPSAARRVDGTSVSGADDAARRSGPSAEQRRHRDDRVDHHGDAECEQDRARDRALRVPHLLAHRGDARVAGEGEEQQPGRLEHPVRARRGPARRGAAPDRRRPPWSPTATTSASTSEHDRHDQPGEQARFA